MKHIFTIAATISLILLVLVSCYYDNEEALYPSYNSTCDTTNVTYSITVVSILRDNCYSCHSGSTAASSGNNIRLDSYTEVSNRNVAISGSINHTGTYSAMPKNGGKLKACSLTQFDIWIRKGMLNN
jgi:hypothetical protein